jgi:hypothetical protein
VDEIEIHFFVQRFRDVKRAAMPEAVRDVVHPRNLREKLLEPSFSNETKVQARYHTNVPKVA